MSDVSTLVVNLVANDTASAVLARLDAELDRSAVGADRAAAAIGGQLASGQQRAAAAAEQGSGAFLAEAGALSRAALAAGDAAAADKILADAGLGLGAAANQGTEATLRFVQAEAGALRASGQWRAAIELLEEKLATMSGRTIEVVNAERQLTTIENQSAAAAQREADAELRLAQAHARTALAAGDHAGALNIVRGAQTSVVGASEAALASLETQIAQFERGGTVVGAFGAQLSALVGPAAIAAAGLGALVEVGKSFAEAFKFKAELDEQRASITALLTGVRDSGTVFSQATHFANEYKLTQQETNEAIQASIPIIRNTKAPIEDVLKVFAQLKVLKPEKTFGDAARALDELRAGQPISLEHQFNVSRDAANRMKKEIEEGGDAVLILSKYLDGAGVNAEALAARTKGAAGALNDAKIAAENLKIAQGQLATSAGGVALLQQQATAVQGLANVMNGQIAITKESTDAFTRYFTVLSGGGGNIAGVIHLFDQERAAQEQAAQTAIVAAGAETSLAAASQAAASATDAAAAAAARSGAAFRDQSQAMIEAANAAQINSEHQTQATTAFGAEEAVIRQTAEASVLASAQQQAQAAETQLLKVQTDAATNSFLQLNPAMTAAGFAASAAASKMPALEAQLIAVALRYRDAANAARDFSIAQGLKGQTAKELRSDVEDVQAAKLDNLRSARDKQVASARAAQEAERRYQEQLGQYGPAIAHAQAELAQLTRGTAAYYDKETEIARLKEQEASAIRKGHHAARLSDQTRLNNQLLAADTKFNQQEEDAEATHQRKLLDIEAEFQKKSLEQQHANEVSKRASRADFYDSLTQATKDIGPKEAQALSAAYEAAYAKAQEIAKSGQQKLAADYLAFKQKEIQDEAEFQKKLAEAQKTAKEGKNKEERKAAAAEAERLRQIHDLRQQAADEEEKQLLAGGDANVNARDAALADETTRFNEAQDKISTASDRSTDRLVTNAQRAGKAVTTDLIPPLERAAAAADRIGARTGVPAQAGGAPAPGTPGTPATPAAGTPGAPVDLSALADALHAAADQISTAVGAVEAATKAGSRDTVGAIKGLQGRLVGT